MAAMTHAGDVFENPATRETGRIITGAGDTGGRYPHHDEVYRGWQERARESVTTTQP